MHADSSPRRRLMLVHAHPDDETLTTGGTIARYAADGVEVILVTCTLGEEGEIIPPGLDQLGAWAADQLGGYRSGELAAACATLGVTEHRYLGAIGRWRDSGMAGAASAEHPRAFGRGSVDEQATQLRALIDEMRPQVVVSYDDRGGYGHPDHIRAHEVTMAAAPGAESVLRVFATVSARTPLERAVDELREATGVPFPIPDRGELASVPDEQVSTVVDVSGWMPAKLAALEAHVTQIKVWRGPPACFALSDGRAQPVLGTEYFTLLDGQGEGADTDLFGGIS